MTDELLNNEDNKVQNTVTRETIMGFESVLKQHPDVVLGDSDLCPLKHSFADGIYMREIFMPAGTILTGKIHKCKHPYVVTEGEVEVATEEGVEHIVAPYSGISPAGVKRALHVIKDTRWITFHRNPSNTQDLKKLEKQIIAPSYEAYDKLQKKIAMKKLKK